MSDHGGRAPEPSDLGSDWVEALLGPPPATKADPAAPAPEPEAGASTTADRQPEGALDPGAALAEALFGTTASSPATTPPEAVAEVSTSPVPDTLLPPVAPPAPTWAEPEPPTPWPAPADEATAADEHEVVDAPVADAPGPLPAFVSDPGPEPEPAPDVWGLPPLTPTAPASDAEALPTAPPPTSSGLPYLGIQPVAEGGTEPGAVAAPDPEPAPAGALVDPSAPKAPAPAGVLDLRPAALAAPAAADDRRARRKAKAPATAKDRRRHRVLAGVGAVLLLVVALVAFQVLSEDDGEPDAVLTADAVQIENDGDDQERGISVGSGEDEAADEAASEDGGEQAATTDTTAATEAAGGGEGATSSGGGGGGAPSGPGRLAVSAGSLEFGSSGSRTVSIRNEGGSSLSWSASTSGGGFAVAGSRSGSLAPGQAHDIQVSFSPNGLPEGAANGTLSIDGRSVALRATVNRPPAISNVSWASCGPTSRLRMTVTDESGIASVAVAGTSPSGSGYRKTAVSQGSGSYRADVGPFSGNGQITYFVEATDSRGNVARSAVQYRAWNDGC